MIERDKERASEREKKRERERKGEREKKCRHRSDMLTCDANHDLTMDVEDYIVSPT